MPNLRIGVDYKQSVFFMGDNAGYVIAYRSHVFAINGIFNLDDSILESVRHGIVHLDQFARFEICHSIRLFILDKLPLKA